MMRKGLMVALLLVLSSLAMVSPAAAQNPVWRAQYYNNANLEGTPVVDRQEPNIAYNYGLNAPVPGVGADGFSIRWATDVSLQPGTYRFIALADDNIRVIFNFGLTPLIDTFASGVVNQQQSANVQVTTAGTYHIQVDYREVTDQAFAYVAFANLATNPGGPVFAAAAPPPQVGVGTGLWTAEYFANTTLTGSPSAIQSENSPSRDFGANAPVPSVPADNWSARWTSIQNIPAGNYTVQVRADDGVRVIINGVIVVNNFGAATGQTFTSNIFLPGGNTSFVVEFVEFTGVAFLDYQLLAVGVQPTPVPQPTQIVSPTGVTGVVTAFRLNVRDLPDAVTGRVVTRVNRNETYPVLGRNSDGTWVQITANGVTGWVNSRFITVSAGNLTTVNPGQQGGGQPVATGLIVTATPYAVNVRSGPGTQFGRIARMNANDTATVVGRTASNQWYQVNYNGIVGWVTSQYAILQQGANVASIPVTG